MAITGIDHVVIRVRDIETGIKTYRDQLGLKLARRSENPAIGKQAFFDLPDGGFIELVAPLSPESAVGKAIERNGEGVHTIAFAVDDKKSTVTAMKTAGATLIGADDPAGIAFVHPKSTHGMLLQIYEKKA